jgi:hypothetical protein
MAGKGSLTSKGNGGNDVFHHQNPNVNIILFFLSHELRGETLGACFASLLPTLF